MRLAGPGNVGLSARLPVRRWSSCCSSLAGVAPHQTVLPRGRDTLVGGALALLAVLAWPVWERGLVPTRLAELLAAYRGYLLTVADLARDLGPHAARAERCRGWPAPHAQASVDRARAEPVPGAARGRARRSGARANATGSSTRC